MYLQLSESPSTISNSSSTHLSPSLSLQLCVPAFLLYLPHPHLLLRACASVSCHSQVWLIAGIRPFYLLEKHIEQGGAGGAVIFNKLWGQGGLSHKWTRWFLTLFSLLLVFILRLMLFLDTSVRGAPTLPPNGTRRLQRPHSLCIESIVFNEDACYC